MNVWLGIEYWFSCVCYAGRDYSGICVTGCLPAAFGFLVGLMLMCLLITCDLLCVCGCSDCISSVARCVWFRLCGSLLLFGLRAFNCCSLL